MKSKPETAARPGAPAERGRAGWWSRIPVSVRRKRGQGDPAPTFAVVDPGSTTLRVLAVGPTSDGPTVLGWGETPVRADEDPAGAFEKALTEAEAGAEQQAVGWRCADQIVVGLPAWQVRGWASPVSQKRSAPSREVDERELESALARALHLSRNKIGAQQNGEWVLLDAVPVALSVDGQGVSDPVGFRGTELTASVFAAAARSHTVEAWTALAEQQGFSSLTITAAPVALAACPSAPHGIILDVGGDHTGVVWWRAGRPLVVGNVGTGGRLLTQCLARQWRLSAEKAETLGRSLSAGQLAPEVREQIIGVLRPALGVWRQAVEGLLAEMHDSSSEPLPHRMLICGGGSSLPEMLEEARALFLSQRLTFGRYPELARLRPTDVRSIANRTELGRGAGDVSALALAAWSGRATEAAGRPARILQGLCR